MYESRFTSKRNALNIRPLQFTQVVPMFLAIVQVAVFPSLLSLIGSMFFFASGVMSLLLTSLV